MDNLTKSLAIEWAASGVRVNSVAPVSAGHEIMHESVLEVLKYVVFSDVCFCLVAGHNLFQNCDGELQGVWAYSL